MSLRHLISRQYFEIRLSRHEEAHEIQQDISRLCSERLTPAFERLFDRLAGPDQLIRLGRIELDIGTILRRELFSDAFAHQLISLLKEAITEELKHASQGAIAQPLRIGRFDVWLYFLEHGYLPAYALPPESQAEWHLHIFETLASDVLAVQRLRQLLSARPIALQRLIVQHEADFLQQIVTLFTARRQDGLPAAISEMVALFVECIEGPSALLQWLTRPDFWKTVLRSVAIPHTLQRLMVQNEEEFLQQIATLFTARKNDDLPSANRKMVAMLVECIQGPAALSQWLTRPDLWQVALREGAIPEDVQAVRAWITRILHRSSEASLRPQLLRQTEIRLWLILLDEVIVRGRKGQTSELLAWVFRHEALGHLRHVVLKALAEKNPSWLRVSQAAQTLLGPTQASLLANKQATQPDFVTKREPPAAADTEFYVPNAGVILLHPFLLRFFSKLELCDGSTFKDEWSRGLAVCLLHHLATGELRTPEYQLVLPKLLCGMLLNAPLDHTIAISAEAQAEGNRLLQSAIDHWGALGSSSPDALREGFLQRAGKLERRQSGWFLLLERNTLDILLDRLPWGIGMIKLPWMEEVLRVEWR